MSLFLSPSFMSNTMQPGASQPGSPLVASHSSRPSVTNLSQMQRPSFTLLPRLWCPTLSPSWDSLPWPLVLFHILPFPVLHTFPTAQPSAHHGENLFNPFYISRPNLLSLGFMPALPVSTGHFLWMNHCHLEFNVPKTTCINNSPSPISTICQWCHSEQW